MGIDITKEDLVKRQLVLSRRRSISILESNAMAPVISKIRRKDMSASANIMKEVSKELIDDENAWTRHVHEIWNIVDAINEANR